MVVAGPKGRGADELGALELAFPLPWGLSAQIVLGAEEVLVGSLPDLGRLVLRVVLLEPVIGRGQRGPDDEE